VIVCSWDPLKTEVSGDDYPQSGRSSDRGRLKRKKATSPQQIKAIKFGFGFRLLVDKSATSPRQSTSSLQQIHNKSTTRPQHTTSLTTRCTTIHSKIEQEHSENANSVKAAAVSPPGEWQYIVTIYNVHLPILMKVENWSQIHIWIRINTKIWSGAGSVRRVIFFLA